MQENKFWQIFPQNGTKSASFRLKNGVRGKSEPFFGKNLKIF